MNDEQLTAQLQQCRETIDELVAALEERGDMQAAIRSLMQSENMLHAFIEMAVKSPDVMRLVLQSGVAALVNTQSVKTIEAEQQRRAGLN